MPKVHFKKENGKYAIALSYTTAEIAELGQKGFFLEAFGRLDKMLDQACFVLLHKRFASADKLVSAIVDDRLPGFEAARILYQAGELDKKTFEAVKRFKEARNTVTHDSYGHYAFALKQAEQVKDEADLVKKADAKAKSELQQGAAAFDALMKALSK
ncbi:MAG: hypothetical protein Q8P02_00900 [Candidatus Micrarchaeota archaeon]|nr:hypothetical protein [Candidatus Micrarchaeota archaeon]